MAIQELVQEDPTLKVSTDPETGQTIIAGMGELHLEIIVDRMQREFGVGANVGQAAGGVPRDDPRQVRSRALVAPVDVDDAVRPRRVGGAALSADAVAVLVGDRALVVDEVRLVGVVEAGRNEVVLDLLGRLRRRWRAAGARPEMSTRA